MLTIHCLNNRTFQCNISLKNFLAMAEEVTAGNAEVNLCVAGCSGIMSMRRVDIEKTMKLAIPDTLRPTGT